MNHEPAGTDRIAHGLQGRGDPSRRLRVLTHPALLVVDEIGYLPVTQDGAGLPFQLITPATNAPPSRSPPTTASRNGRRPR